MSEFESRNNHIEDLSYRRRMQVLANRATIAGLVEAQPVTPPEMLSVIFEEPVYHPSPIVVEDVADGFSIDGNYHYHPADI